jgi:hypothetical protein
MQPTPSNSSVVKVDAVSAPLADSTTSSAYGDLFERAFQLAYFIVQDRSAAIEIVDRARLRLGTEQSREKKRAYWRIRPLKQRIRRITRDVQDTLQWLIYLESEGYERELEQKQRISKRSLVVWYIKSIVQMTGSMSSFYVAVGLHRILHNYATPELQDAYELLTADFPGAEKYRRVKQKLMQMLAKRFCHFLTVRKSENQELRFEVDEDQQDWADLATICLEKFTPWSTRNACLPEPISGRMFADGGAASTSRNRLVAVDVEEMRSCHILIHPPCFDQVTCRLRLDPRPTRLAMPRFTMNNDEHPQDKSPYAEGDALPLTAEERAILTRPLSSRLRQQQRETPKSLIIRADGNRCAQLDLSREAQTQWKVIEGTRLIEFCTEKAGSEEIDVLAMHWIEYTATDGIAAGEHTIALGSGRGLILKTIPADPKSEEAGDAAMLLAVRGASRLVRWKESLPSLLWRSTMPRYALAAILILLGWLWSAHRYRQQIAQQQFMIAKLDRERVSAQTALESLKQQLAQTPPDAATAANYRLLPDSLAIRSLGNAKLPIVVLDRGAAQLELPVYSRKQRLYRATLKLFWNKTELLRENLLKPRQTETGQVVMFTLPAAAVTESGRYVITLEAISSGAPVRVGDFSFYLEKH